MNLTHFIELPPSEGSDEYKEVEVVVHYNFQPEEKAFFNAKEGYGHPGCAADCEVWQINEWLPRGTHGPKREWEYGDLDASIWEGLETYILENLEEEGDY